MERIEKRDGFLFRRNEKNNEFIYKNSNGSVERVSFCIGME